MYRWVGSFVFFCFALFVPAQAQVPEKPTCTIGDKPYFSIERCQAEMNALADVVKRDAEALKQKEKPRNTKIYFRQNFDDLKSFASPSDASKAKGFQISVTKDKTNDSSSQVFQGLIGIGWSKTYDYVAAPHIQAQAFGIYAAGDRIKNPGLPKTNKDILTTGARYEILAANIARVNHFFSFSTDVVSGFDGDTRNWKLGIDYFIFGTESDTAGDTILNYFNDPRLLPGSKYWLYEISPRLRAEYRGNMSKALDPVFGSDDRIFRTGFYIAYNLARNWTYKGKEADSLFTAPAGQIPLLISRSVFNVSYGYWYDARSGRDFKLLEAAYTFNLNEPGTAGITFAYRRGDHEETGIEVDLFKISLGLKLDLTPVRTE